MDASLLILIAIDRQTRAMTILLHNVLLALPSIQANLHILCIRFSKELGYLHL
jgi:hypothetical protein